MAFIGVGIMKTGKMGCTLKLLKFYDRFFSLLKNEIMNYEIFISYTHRDPVN